MTRLRQISSGGGSQGRCQDRRLFFKPARVPAKLDLLGRGRLQPVSDYDSERIVAAGDIQAYEQVGMDRVLELFGEGLASPVVPVHEVQYAGALHMMT